MGRKNHSGLKIIINAETVRATTELFRTFAELVQGLSQPRLQEPRGEIRTIPQEIDPYVILGLAKNATREQVKRRYAKLSQIHHPDHGGTNEGFILIQKAYDKIMREGA